MHNNPNVFGLPHRQSEHPSCLLSKPSNALRSFPIPRLHISHETGVPMKFKIQQHGPTAYIRRTIETRGNAAIT
jgi:hypothetical protein